MILIAFSGSTKCDWRLVSADRTYKDISTIGLNPFFQNEAFIEAELNSYPQLEAIADSVKVVFFYGAGCSSKELKRVVERGLAPVFPNARIHVDHDMIAAALAVYEDDPCIACILGTGSNSCHFDGDIAREEVPSLSYILGDEGSGAYFGKRLLADFLYKKLPSSMHDVLVNEFKLTKDIIFDRVYMKPNANVYLASFMPFISEFKSERYVRNMLRAGLGEFLDAHVKCYPKFEELKTHFVGSIAVIHEDILREESEWRGIDVGKIIRHPLDGLIEYHEKHHFDNLF